MKKINQESPTTSLIQGLVYRYGIAGRAASQSWLGMVVVGFVCVGSRWDTPLLMVSVSNEIG